MKQYAVITFEGHIPEIDILESLIPQYKKHYKLDHTSFFFDKEELRFSATLTSKVFKGSHVDISVIKPGTGLLNQNTPKEDLTISSSVPKNADEPAKVVLYANGMEIYGEKIVVAYAPADFPDL